MMGITDGAMSILSARCTVTAARRGDLAGRAWAAAFSRAASMEICKASAAAQRAVLSAKHEEKRKPSSPIASSHQAIDSGEYCAAKKIAKCPTW